MAASCPLPACRLAGTPPGHSNQEIPRGEELKLGLLFPKNLFPQHLRCHPPPGVLLTVSPCPGDAGSLWMLPWKGPQEKPSGRLLRLRTRLCPSCTSRSSSSAGRHAQHQRDAPQNPPGLQHPKIPGDVGTQLECPVGGSIPFPGVPARRKERFPSPRPKSQRLQALMALII